MQVGALQVSLDLAGIFVFALSGALAAIRNRLDIVGVLVLAGVTGLGGGMIRDLLINAAPPATLMDWRYLTVPALAGLVAFRFHPALGRLERSINVFDALGLGLFCVTGSAKAILYGLGPVPSALMGMLTGIGGGVLRDLLSGRAPVVFKQEVYALPALAGSTVVVLSWHYGWYRSWVAIVAAGLCTSLRLLAIRFSWQLPRPQELRD